MYFFWRISENCPPDRSSHSRKLNEDASKDNHHVFQVGIDFILSAIQRLFYLFNCEFDHGH